MTSLEFLHSSPIAALLERAARAAGVPVSIHFLERNQEGPKIEGWGQCGACRHVQTVPGGNMACRLSRTAASVMALRQQRPIPFVCHLGLASVSAALLPDAGYVVTFGPYCPMEEQRSLEDDVRAGLGALTGEEPSELPVSLDDIHRPPANAVPAVVEWLVEAVRDAWATHEGGLVDVAEETGRRIEADLPTAHTSRTRDVRGARDSQDASAIAALLAAGSRKEARAQLIGALEEIHRGGGKAILVRRAHMVAMVGRMLESLARAGTPVASAWPDLAGLHAALARAETDGELADAALGVFRFLRTAEAREAVTQTLPNYPELFALVKDRLLDGITLDEVAAALGETPSAISHRLKRKFGLSFSDYMARLRVDRAKQLFRRTKLDVSEVAQRVGIGDPSNFARLFRKVEGMTPAAYRKQYGKKA